MPQMNSSNKSGKQSKAAKAAKAILHPKSTIAAAKANHSRSSSVESAKVSDASMPTKSPASSIKKTPSNASIASGAARALSKPPSASASPARNTASLPTSAQAPSFLGPPVNNDLLSMKKQAIECTKSAQQTPPTAPASLPPAVAALSAPPRASPAAIPVAQSTSASSTAAPVSAAADVPYTIEETSVESQVNNAPVEPSLSAHTDKTPALDPSVSAPTVTASTVTRSSLGQQSAPSAQADNLVSSHDLQDPKAKATQQFASEVAEALANSTLDPQQVTSDVAAAPTPIALTIVNKAAEVVDSTEPDSTPSLANTSTSKSTEAEPASAEDFAATVAAVVKVSSYTPPELACVQHNTFVSRPTHPSRAGIDKLDASTLPLPLRRIDGQGGVVRSPSHVIIFGWMDAPIRLVCKYAQPYTVLFPDATIFIQLSDGKSYLARENVRREQLQHVIAEISSSSNAPEKGFKEVQTKDVGDSTITLIDHSEARSSSSSEDGKEAAQVGGFVIHSFSDGGAGNLALFLDEMARRKGASARVHSLIMDSSPGKSNAKTGSIAFTMHLANRPLLRAIVRFFVYLGLYLLKIWTKLTGQPQRGELMRKRLNSLRSWSWVTASHTPKPQQVEKKADADYPPRMYMYTKADQLIPWQFVEEHAHDLARISEVQQGLVQMENESERQKLLEAVRQGKTRSEREYKVELRRWNTPPHCSIGRSDFEGYWAALIDFYTNVLSRG
ncbi:hypothetical protein NDA11_006874 [Ustilago hordei]|uniref:Uncharacterized protein n=1 Tax=Ustilago hordei TaxID=120017 RepID=I2FN49_USTHO|nr:uncharacterized protein UHO2_05298 [Ustilago hordei]KAJ1039937.1 hypothetical protein NDA10_005685 [Ustilago hordei]KAJ1574130.1 hypothetical protein NDA12_005046 [Ustilago hordei]KAJ1574632.1 hypothetical protein NDA15_007596 [Ustilago hordei]KAJ1580439.1 hypothetical protein NDA11_006874 [Ustilago hordei]KAJ1599383.1 hypothetical protein NDA14_000224 [Ustilago hordei]